MRRFQNRRVASIVSRLWRIHTWPCTDEEDLQDCEPGGPGAACPAQIVGLTVKEAEDADGDPILRIDVVFEAAEGRLDPKKVLGLIRNLRKPLADEGGTPHLL